MLVRDNFTEETLKEDCDVLSNTVWAIEKIKGLAELFFVSSLGVFFAT